MSFTAIFRDGPLGGQYREVERPEHIYRVPVLARKRPISEYGGVIEPAYLAPPEIEEYELLGCWNGRVLEYRWVNPADSLHAENKRLREQIRKAKEALG